MEPSTLEAMVEQLISDHEDIRDLVAVLDQPEIELSIDYCYQLIGKLTDLAAATESTVHFEAFAKACSNIFGRISSSTSRERRKLLRNTLSALNSVLLFAKSKCDATLQIPAPFGATISTRSDAFNLAAIFAGCLAEVLSSNTIFYDIAPRLWSSVVYLTEAAVEHALMQDAQHYILTILPKLYTVCCSHATFQPSSLQAENALMALLNVMKQQNLENSTNFVASLLQCANMILEQNVIQTICNVVPISDTLKTLVETRNIAEQAQQTFLHIACLLMKCRADIPWIEPIIHTAPDDMVLKVEAQLLLHDLDIRQKTLPNPRKRPRTESYSQYLRSGSNDYLQQNIAARLHGMAPGLIDELINAASISEAEYYFGQIKTLLGEVHPFAPTVLQDINCSLAEATVYFLRQNTDIPERIASLYDLKLCDYLYSRMCFILPFTLRYAMDGEDLLSCVCAKLRTEPEALCNAGFSYVMADILLSNDDYANERSLSRMSRLLGSRDTIENLVCSNVSEIASLLAMELGVPSRTSDAKQALSKLIVWSKQPADTNLPDFLSCAFFPILEKIRVFISECRVQQQIKTYPYALQSLEEIVGIMGPRIAKHAFQIMTLLQAFSETASYGRQIFAVWKRFIDCLGAERDVFLSSIIHGLLDIFPSCDTSLRNKIGQLILDVLTSSENQAFLEHGLPEIPPYPELDDLRNFLQGRQACIDTPEHLLSIIERLYSSELSDVIAALQLLRRLAEHNAVGRVNVVEGYRGRIYSALLYLSSRNLDQPAVKELIADCLGMLGAMDPSRLDVNLQEEGFIVTDNFTVPAENRNFVCFLLLKQLVPAFHAAGDEQQRRCIQYAFQMVLRFADFTNKSVRESNIDSNQQTPMQQWEKLPHTVRTLLSPFLHSSFESSWRLAIPSYPIYPNMKTHGDWIQGWYYKLLERANENASPLFSSCIPAIKSGNIELASFLMPYLVLHVILSGSDSDVVDITNELITVLDINSEPNAKSEATRHGSLQMVVSIIDYCQKWLRRNQKLAGGRRSPDVDLVRKFLAQIPNDKMSMASLRCKAYAQALMHLELHIKADLQKRGGVNPNSLDHLRQIYAHIDDTDGAAAVFSLFKRTLSLDEEILQFESTKQWQMARVCYEIALDRSENKDNLLAGYLNCLGRSGSNDTLLDITTRMLTEYPKWCNDINAHRAEAAWKAAEWDILDEAIKMPIAETFGARLGCTIGHLRQQNYAAALCDMEMAKFAEIERLAAVSRISYERSHDHIVHLQAIHEISEAQIAWEEALASGDPQPLMNLQKTWSERDAKIMPTLQAKRELLEVRKIALFEMRKQNVFTRDDFDDGSVWVSLAKTARKLGDMDVALGAILRAESIDPNIICTQRAKWYWQNNEKYKAVQYLQTQARLNPDAHLLYAKYYDEFETQDKQAVLQEYRKMLKTNANSEKAFYHMGRFYDSHLPAREFNTMSPRHIKLAMFVVSNYCKALTLGTKYFYYTMPRLLTLWTELGNATLQTNPINHSSQQTLLEVFRYIQVSIKDSIDKIPPYVFCAILPRLVSRLSHKHNEIASTLDIIISKVLHAYPRTAIWALLPSSESKIEALRERCANLLNRTLAQTQKDDLIVVVIQQARKFTKCLKELAAEQINLDRTGSLSISRFPSLERLSNLELCVPTQKALHPVLPEKTPLEQYGGPFPNDLPVITGFGPQYEVMRSLQQPKKITLVGSDGQTYGFLCKKNDDLRKDARMMEFSTMINKFLKEDEEARQRKLYIRTYAIIPLGESWGLIEWINNLKPLKGIVAAHWRTMGIDIKQIQAYAKHLLDGKTEEKKEEAFVQNILPKCPPVFHRWFLENFPEPTQWLASRSRYIKTLAVMSIVGYALGLGDRHAENILFDETNGDCVHVDVNMLFDKGLQLAVPEIVPFRLTNNLIDAMGVFGHEGMFKRSCEVTLNMLRHNKTQLLTVFETFAHDPITEWHKRKHPRQLDVQEMAREQVQKIDDKIGGKKTVQDDVKELIARATNNYNLAQMFIGWAPYI